LSAEMHPGARLKSGTGRTELAPLGWDAHFEKAFAAFVGDGLVPARVAVQHRGAYVVCAETGELSAEPSGRLRHESGPGSLPVAGDWVVIRPHEDGSGAIIHAVLPRRTSISRKAAWLATEEQVLGANIDVVFLVAGLDGDLNLRRLERYLATVWNSGAEPVVVLSKADVCDDVESALISVAAVAIGVPVHVVSGLTGEGVDELRPYLAPNRTVALLGSSGVGKSTLINCLRGEDVQAVGPVRKGDGRGRHTTTSRELVRLPGGGLLLDTPGMRELQLWDADDGLETTFADVEALAADCRFNDCSHEREPGCAIRRALADGSLDRARYAAYGKLQRELHALAVRQDKRLQAEARKERRRFGRARRHPKRW
jgi:ribosome biogenesis GTPase / thiamine phosphate phosphatase